MKFAVLLLLGLMLLATPVLASSVDFSNSGGPLTGSNAGLTLSGSILTSINSGSSGLLTGNLGTVSFSTNSLISGDLQHGGVFDAGGSFSIIGNGTDGIPNGAIFTGTFSEPATWTLITLSNGTHQYTLTAALKGTWFTGITVEGATVQLTMNTGTGFFNGSGTLASGDINITGQNIRITPTPEPGTLGMLGAGLLAIGGLVRRKLKSVI
jgi:hypothetical protein